MRRVLLALLLLAAVPVGARELSWDALEVTAHLDSAGTLHVRERQHFVFTGDWNGGERRFRVEDGQELDLRAVRRIDAAGIVELHAGNLSDIDSYAFSNGALRWRSRLPSDPEFDHTRLTYEIEYELRRILVGIPGGSGRPTRYLLDHDFAFDDRPGVIRQFRLSLDLDPAWRPSEPLPAELTAEELPPGSSFIVRRELTYSGAGTPATAYVAPLPWVRLAVLGLLLIGLPAVFTHFWRGERARGRFGRVHPAIDASWLEEHVFRYPPEVVGYIHDGKSGPAEVAATLARMQQEGTIKTSVEPRVLRAPLLRMTLRDGEFDLDARAHKLVNLFFFRGSTETDTDTIRAHYRTRGFDPAGGIEPALRHAARAVPGWSEDRPPAADPGERRLLAIAFLLLVAGALFGGRSLWLMIYMAVLGGIGCLVGRAVARRSANQTRWLPLRWLGASIPTLLLAWLLSSVARRELTQVREIPLVIAGVFVLTVYRFVLRAARTDQTLEKLELRARLAAVRAWFASQLRRETPSLDDAWMPYLIALGLGRNADRWFSRFAGAAPAGGVTGESSATSSPSSSWGSSSSTAGGSGWTGGGGLSGGAGATASWALAATALASGSSAPSSSGSSSGGSSSSGGGGDSGGGSSSGGGGGGGW